MREKVPKLSRKIACNVGFTSDHFTDNASPAQRFSSTECASAANAPMKRGGAATEIIRARQQQALVRRHTRIRLGPLSRCRRKRPFAVN